MMKSLFFLLTAAQHCYGRVEVDGAREVFGAGYNVTEEEIPPSEAMTALQEMTILNVMMDKIKKVVSERRLSPGKHPYFTVKVGGKSISHRRIWEWPYSGPDQIIIELDPMFLSEQQRKTANLTHVEDVSWGQPDENVVVFPYAVNAFSGRMPMWVHQESPFCSTSQPPAYSFSFAERETAAHWARRSCWFHSRLPSYKDTRLPWSLITDTQGNKTVSEQGFFGEECPQEQGKYKIEVVPAISLSAFLRRIHVEFPDLKLRELFLDHGVGIHLMNAASGPAIRKVDQLIMHCQRIDELFTTRNIAQNATTFFRYSNQDGKEPAAWDCQTAITMLQKVGFTKTSDFKVVECATGKYQVKLDMDKDFAFGSPIPGVTQSQQ